MGERLSCFFSLAATKRGFTSLTGGELGEWAQVHEPRGEYVILVDEISRGEDSISEEGRLWLRLLANELPSSRLAALAAKATGCPRDDLYQLICEFKNNA